MKDCKNQPLKIENTITHCSLSQQHQYKQHQTLYHLNDLSSLTVLFHISATKILIFTL